MEQKNTEILQGQMEDEVVIDLGEVLRMILQHFVLIVEAGLALGAIAFLICSLLIPKTYVSTTQIYVLNRQSESATVTYSDLQSGTYLTKDYQELITSLPVLEQVIAQLQLECTTGELAGQISVNSPTDTRIIEISVEDTDPYMAREIADAVRVATSRQIAQVMDIEAVNIIQRANYPDGASGPATLRMTILGCAAGAFLACVILLVLYLMDDTIKTPDDVESVMGLSVLGSIPILKSEMDTKQKKKKKAKHKAPKTENRKRARV